MVCVLKGITHVLKHDDISQLDHYSAADHTRGWHLDMTQELTDRGEILVYV